MKDTESDTSVEGSSCFSELHRAIRDKYVNTTITFILIMGFLYLLISSVYGRNILHPLSGDNEVFSENMTNNVVSVFVLLVSALAFGWILSVIRLPPLFGALLVGIAFRNIPLLSETFRFDENWLNLIRVASLSCMMPKWGLSIRWLEIKRRPFLPLTVGILTPIAEAASIGVASHLIFGMDLSISFLAGFLLAAVSPAITVPVLLDLQNDGRGENKVVPGLLAAATLDNVVCLFSITVAMTSIFSQDTPSGTLFHIILQIFTGLVAGVAFGVLLWFFPLSSNANSGLIRSVILAAAASAAFFGFNAVRWTCTGIISSLLLSFVASCRWKVDNDRGTKTQENIAENLWALLFLPLLFSSIGMRLDLENLEKSTVLWSLALIGIGQVARFLSTLVLSLFSLNVKESLFVAFSMLPKATVQAALGPSLLGYIALFPEMGDQLNAIVTTAIITIFLTAPIGQLLIQVLAPLLLRRESPNIPTYIYNHYENDQRLEDKDIILNGIGAKSFIKADEVSLRF
ncbi:unnamed protein product [Auanema sp. JU1783]|nr:unnamed protein product [Auanema sp. JU1783]